MNSQEDGIKPWIAVTNAALCLAVGGVLLSKAKDS
jgi:hypothetical protein